MAQRVTVSHKMRAKTKLLTSADYLEEAQSLLCNYGQAINATNLALKRKFSLPSELYEAGLKICVTKADVLNAAECLYQLGREFTAGEFKHILDLIIASGNIKGLADLQNLNREVFGLAIWQNTIIFRVRRLSWTRKNSKTPEIMTTLEASDFYSAETLGIKIRVCSGYTCKITNRVFQLFFNETMAQFTFALSQLEKDKTNLIMARGISDCSPISPPE